MRKPLFERMAAYNGWANRRLCAACAALPEAEYLAARPAFFGSIHRTLNHLLVADRIWLSRLEGRPITGLALDAELCADLASLRAARAAQDVRIEACIQALGEADLDRRMAYTNSSGARFEDPVELVLQHMFNHQTHHRGQVHDMLTATAVPPPPLDLIYYARELQPAP